MSNNVNSNLLERAKVAIEYSAGKPQAQVIQMHLDDSDLDALAQSVKQVEDVMFQNEYNPEPELEPEVESSKDDFDWSDHERELREPF